MLGEWVVVTPRRAGRPFQEKDRECPFCPGRPETRGPWRVLTLDNKFSALNPDGGPVGLQEGVVIGAPAYGLCKIILLSRDHKQQIETMDNTQLALVFSEYLRVFSELSSQPGIKYVMEFENRGRAIGVSLDHPHAQVYALPFVPPRILKEAEQSKTLWDSEGSCLICQTIEKEVKSEDRIIKQTEDFISLVPYAARLPYETHIYPKTHVSSLVEMKGLLLELGQVIRDVVRRYAAVFDEVAYVMVFHTRPGVGDHPYWHFHVELYPPWRDKNRLKYLAGIETGAWTYTNDSTPEEKAKELRSAVQ